MLSTGQKATVDRDVLLAICAELLEARALLARLGGDLRAVARRAAGSADRTGPTWPPAVSSSVPGEILGIHNVKVAAATSRPGQTDSTSSALTRP
jgi:hypothetical protein